MSYEKLSDQRIEQNGLHFVEILEEIIELLKREKYLGILSFNIIDMNSIDLKNNSFKSSCMTVISKEMVKEIKIDLMNGMLENIKQSLIDILNDKND
jgi:hypothetical protein